MVFRSHREKFFLFLVCLIVGTMISTQFRSAEQAKQSVNQQRAEDLVEKLKNAEKENRDLANRLEELETQGAGGDKKVLNDLRIKSGEVALKGPVVVTVNDSQVKPKAALLETARSGSHDAYLVRKVDGFVQIMGEPQPVCDPR